MNKTSHHIGGFWFHISWKGENGTDQHGRKWTNRQNPSPVNQEWLKLICTIITDAISLISKKAI
jgi:hypothetical protein